MRIEVEYPFSDFVGYLNLHKGMNRMQVCLVFKGDRNVRKTITYAKYLMSVHLGRALHRNEEVDHIDGDKRNDCFHNLQIMSRKENYSKYARSLETPMKKLTCPFCGIKFTIKLSQERRKRKINKNIFCARSCAAKFYYNDKNRGSSPCSFTNTL